MRRSAKARKHSERRRRKICGFIDKSGFLRSPNSSVLPELLFLYAKRLPPLCEEEREPCLFLFQQSAKLGAASGAELAASGHFLTATGA